MTLSLSSRWIGDVAIVRCCGRVVAGSEVDSLRNHVTSLLQECRYITLHLGDVVFIDSSGLGALVRLLTTIRREGGDLKFCEVPQNLAQVLKMTNLVLLFDIHPSEEEAVTSFYRMKIAPRQGKAAGPSVLCVDKAVDVLACLRGILQCAGYTVLTNSHLHDSLILVRATRPRLVILGSNLAASPGTREAFHAACANTPLVELQDDFSTQDAGTATTALLETIRTRLQG
jgi:anti-sigma B factor antagonist